ncbi:MAG: hypothetical protein HY751_02365 [Nitrospinae bacterium]|nr:hypothetical protein [Nitrospinota bacterium]
MPNTGFARGLKIFAALVLFHFMAAGAMSAVARTGFMAGHHNGAGLWEFGKDSYNYHATAAELAGMLKSGDTGRWLRKDEPFHVKTLSMIYYATTPDPLMFEPLNALAWAAQVALVYFLVMRLTAGGAGFAGAAALLFGLMPSTLLLSTQLLKDPFYNLGVLLMGAGWVALLTNERRFLFVTAPALGAVICGSIRVEAKLIIALVAIISLGLIAWRARPALIHAAAAVALTLMALFGQVAIPAYAQEPDRVYSVVRANVTEAAYTPQLQSKIARWLETAPWPSVDERRAVLENLARAHKEGLEPFMDRFLTQWRYTGWIPRAIEQQIFRASQYRDSFLTYYITPDTNTVDSTILFRDVYDIARYIPRGAQIGLFSPFPNTWLSDGQGGGRLIRLVGGLETAFWYAMYIGFMIYLARAGAGAHVKVWLVISVVLFILPLGLFVPNLGTLFRMRHIYLYPVIIGGLEGWRLMTGRKP